MHAAIAHMSYQPTASDARNHAARLTLVAGYGIAGDRKAGRNPKRHLNLISQEALAQTGAEPGDLGEQIVVAGLDVESLPRGAHVQLGASVIIEITMPRTGCAKFARFQPDADVPLGVMATVICGGELRIGDAILVLEPA